MTIKVIKPGGKRYYPRLPLSGRTVWRDPVIFTPVNPLKPHSSKPCGGYRLETQEEQE